MNKLVTKLILIIFSAVFFVVGNKMSHGQDFNILIIGDDVTLSTNGANGYGWRYYLDTDLQVDAGFPYSYDFIGTQSGNQGGNPAAIDGLYDDDHEAHYTYMSFSLGRELPVWLQNYSADIALIHAGTIEMNEGVEAYEERVHLRLSGIVRTLRMANPRITIFLAQIIPINIPAADGPHEAILDATNVLIGNIATELADPNSPIIIVNQNTGFHTEDSDPGDTWYLNDYPLPNWYIPNNTGAQEMADRWRAAITANIPDVKNRWTGATSSDWTDPSNWNQGSVPISTEDVVITQSASNWPTFNGNFSVGLDCRDFIMEPNTQFTVNGDFIVRIESTLRIFNGATVNVSGDWKDSESVLGGGNVNLSGGTPTYFNTDAYMELDCDSPFELLSVKVYPNNSTLPGSRTFYWSAYDSDLTDWVIQEEIIVEIPNDPELDGERIDLNFNITVSADIIIKDESTSKVFTTIVINIFFLCLTLAKGIPSELKPLCSSME